MVINALNSGADGFMADFEDANAPTWRNMVEGHINLRDAIEGTITYDGSDGRHYELGATIPRRCWSGRAAGTCPSATCWSAASRSRARCSTSACTSSTARRGCWRAARGPYLYLPEAGVPPRGAAVERRVLLRPGRGRPGARHDQGDGADRDAAGGVRDGRDPLRAARALGGSERRPLGLHLLGHQVLPRPARDGAARSRRRDDDGAVHARLHRAAGRHLPSPRRPRHGRDGGADPVAPRRGGQRQGARGRARRQAARGRARATTGPGWRTPTWSRSRARCSSRGCERRRQPARAPARRRARSAPRELLDLAVDARARSPRPGCAPTSTSAFSTSRSGSAAAARRRSTR